MPNPEFLETQRQKGRSDSVIADFYAKKDPAFSNARKKYIAKYGSGSIGKFLDYMAYGTTEPKIRFSPGKGKSFPTPPEQPQSEMDWSDPANPENKQYNPVVQFGSKIAGDAKEAIQTGANEFGDALERQGAGEQGVLDTTAELVGETGKAGAKIFGSAFLNTLSAITPDIIEEPAKRKAVEGLQALMQTDTGKAAVEKVGEISDWYKNLEEEDPVTAERIDSALGIGQLLLTLTGAEQTIKGTQKLAAKAGSKLDDVMELNAAGMKRSLEQSAIQRADDIAKETDNVVAQIIQGDKPDIPKAKSALRQIGSTKTMPDGTVKPIETFDELDEVISEKIKGIAQKQDELLGGVEGAKKLNQFNRVVKKGKTGATTNHVRNALDQLEELYEKSSNIDDLASIKALRQKASAEGLTAQEINNLAREYNRSVSSIKAFSTRGTPLRSATSETAETTRKGVKEVARSMMPDEATTALDDAMTDLYNTRRLIRNLASKAQKDSQKLESAGPLEKAGAAAVKAVDTATFGGMRGILKELLPGTQLGKKNLDVLELQNLLKKNLETVSKAISNAQ